MTISVMTMKHIFNSLLIFALVSVNLSQQHDVKGGTISGSFSSSSSSSQSSSSSSSSSGSFSASGSVGSNLNEITKGFKDALGNLGAGAVAGAGSGAFGSAGSQRTDGVGGLAGSGSNSGGFGVGGSYSGSLASSGGGGFGGAALNGGVVGGTSAIGGSVTGSGSGGYGGGAAGSGGYGPVLDGPGSETVPISGSGSFSTNKEVGVGTGVGGGGSGSAGFGAGSGFGASYGGSGIKTSGVGSISGSGTFGTGVGTGAEAVDSKGTPYNENGPKSGSFGGGAGFGTGSGFATSYGGSGSTTGAVGTGTFPVSGSGTFVANTDFEPSSGVTGTTGSGSKIEVSGTGGFGSGAGFSGNIGGGITSGPGVASCKFGDKKCGTDKVIPVEETRQEGPAANVIGTTVGTGPESGSITIGKSSSATTSFNFDKGTTESYGGSNIGTGSSLQPSGGETPITYVHYVPGSPSASGGYGATYGSHPTTVPGTGNHGPLDVSKKPCCNGPYPGPIGSIHQSKPASSVPAPPALPWSGSHVTGTGGNFGSHGSGHIGGSAGTGYPVGGSKGPCCKGPFPGPNGSIHDSKPASAVPPIPAPGAPSTGTYVPGTAYGPVGSYSPPSSGDSKGPCCKGPFPGPNGSIHDSKPASSVPPAPRPDGPATGTYAPSGSFRPGNGGHTVPCCKELVPGGAVTGATASSQSTITSGVYGGSGPFPSTVSSNVPSYVTSNVGSQTGTSYHYSGSHIGASASGPHEPATGGYEPSRVFVPKPSQTLYPPITGTVSYKPLPVSKGYNPLNPDFISADKTDLAPSGSPGLPSLVDSEKNGGFATGSVSIEKEDRSITTEKTKYPQTIPGTYGSGAGGISGSKQHTQSSGTYGAPVGSNVGTGSGYASGSVSIEKPGAPIVTPSDTYEAPTSSGIGSGYATGSVSIQKPDGSIATPTDTYGTNSGTVGGTAPVQKPAGSWTIPSTSYGVPITTSTGYGNGYASGSVFSQKPGGPITNSGTYGVPASPSGGFGNGYATGSVAIQKPDGSVTDGTLTGGSIGGSSTGSAGSYGGHKGGAAGAGAGSGSIGITGAGTLGASGSHSVGSAGSGSFGYSGSSSFGSGGSSGSNVIKDSTGSGGSGSYGGSRTGSFGGGSGFGSSGFGGGFGGGFGHSLGGGFGGASSYGAGHAGSSSFGGFKGTGPGFSGLLGGLFGKHGLGGNLGLAGSGSFAKSGSFTKGGSFAGSSSFAGASAGSYAGHY